MYICEWQNLWKFNEMVLRMNLYFSFAFVVDISSTTLKILWNKLFIQNVLCYDNYILSNIICWAFLHAIHALKTNKIVKKSENFVLEKILKCLQQMPKMSATNVLF